MWANYMFVLRDAMQHDGTILVVKYEDFLADKVEIFRDVFEKLGLDTALTAFDKDFQRGTVASRSRVGQLSTYVISGKKGQKLMLFFPLIRYLESVPTSGFKGIYIYIINKFNKCQDLPQNLMLADRFHV